MDFDIINKIEENKSQPRLLGVVVILYRRSRCGQQNQKDIKWKGGSLSLQQ